MPNLERVNIAPQARELREQGYVDGYSEAKFNLPFSISDKPELYALTAVMIDGIVARAYENRDNQAILSRVSPEAPFFNLEEEMFKLLKDETRATVTALGRGLGSQQLQTVFDRFKIVREKNVGIYPAEKFINSGTGTATGTIANVLSLVPAMMEGDRTPVRMIRAAQASYPLVVKLASMHRNAFTSFRDNVSDDEVARYRLFRAGHFRVEPLNGQERLVLSSFGEEVMDQVMHEQDMVYEPDADGPRVGCPALVNFGENSALKTLWDWHMELAQKIYPALHASWQRTEDAA